MSFNFTNLDQRTRELMLDEVNFDAAQNSLYISPRLNAQGIQQYQTHLRVAIQNGNETTLADNIRNGLLNRFEPRTRNGVIRQVRVPRNAHEMLAEGEFNRFYIRALCLRVLEDGTGTLEIYRAKQVANPRPTSQARIGQAIDPTRLLNDLRNNPGVEPALGLPPGPNSGLSVRMILRENSE